MQVLSMSDLSKACRFGNSRKYPLERSKDVLADDSMEVALMVELLHRGADANQADEMVSFCPQIVGCCLTDIELQSCVIGGLKFTQCPAVTSIPISNAATPAPLGAGPLPILVFVCCPMGVGPVQGKQHEPHTACLQQLPVTCPLWLQGLYCLMSTDSCLALCRVGRPSIMQQLLIAPGPYSCSSLQALMSVHRIPR